MACMFTRKLLCLLCIVLNILLYITTTTQSCTSTNQIGLCIKVGRGHGTRVWGLGTWGRETRDLKTSSMGRGDVKNRDAGDAGGE